jgi:exosortase/archaeosortase family protein
MAEYSNELLDLKEILLYLLLFSVITWSFQMVPTGWLEKVTASLSSQLLTLFKFSSSWKVHGGDSYLIFKGGIRNVTVEIIRECTGIHVVAIFTGLVLPLKGGLWLRKLFSLLTASTLLFIMNVSRVILTVLLTAYDIPPFAWIFINPTVQTYHYPLSFLYGLLGVALLTLLISRYILPELGVTLLSIPYTFARIVHSHTRARAR